MSDQPAAPTTAPKKFVFVLMPFDQSFEDVYQVGIKAACRDAGAYCERVDEQIFHQSILERVYNQIAKADLIVADMTGRNINVFYEVGYAHALNKRAILLTQNADDIPFDLKHYPHIVYKGSITNLRSDLERQVRWYLAQPDLQTHDFLGKLVFFIEGQQITDNAEIKIHNVARPSDNLASGISARDSSKTRHHFDLLLHNRSDDFIQFDRLRLSIITQGSHNFCRIHLPASSQSYLPDGGFISWLDVQPEILPGAWERIDCMARIDFGQLEPDHIHTQIECPVRFQAVTPFGKRQIELLLRF